LTVCVRDFLAVEPDRAALGEVESQQQHGQGRFATSICSDDEHNLARPNRQVYRTQHEVVVFLIAGETMVNTFHFQPGRCRIAELPLRLASLLEQIEFAAQLLYLGQRDGCLADSRQAHHQGAHGLDHVQQDQCRCCNGRDGFLQEQWRHEKDRANHEVELHGAEVGHPGITDHAPAERVHEVSRTGRNDVIDKSTSSMRIELKFLSAFN
jgi:hypothetical protein